MIKLFADGADWDGILQAAAIPKIVGFTTNPTLMKQAGVTDYTAFSQKLIQYLKDKRPDTCLSLEVFADDNKSMLKQARTINSWANDYNVYIKIPITNTQGKSCVPVVKQLASEGIKCNVTAVFTEDQVTEIVEEVDLSVPIIVSIFAGRIADAGTDPVEIFNKVKEIHRQHAKKNDELEFLWASSREAYNYVQARLCGCDIITMTMDLIKKMNNFGKDLNQFSLETVQMFYNDAVKSGFKI